MEKKEGIGGRERGREGRKEGDRREECEGYLTSLLSTEFPKLILPR